MEPPSSDAEGRSAYGQGASAVDGWDPDRVEGATIEGLKWSAQEAFPDPLIQVPDDYRGNIAVTSMDALVNWSRRSATWPVAFGLACCVFEMLASAMGRFDLARFGMEAMRASPRQAEQYSPKQMSRFVKSIPFLKRTSTQ